MPASKALEIWNDSIKDAGWKKNSELQDDPDFRFLPVQMNQITESLERRASNEQSQTTPEINASKNEESGVTKSQWISKQRRGYHKHDGFPE